MLLFLRSYFADTKLSITKRCSIKPCKNFDKSPCSVDRDSHSFRCDVCCDTDDLCNDTFDQLQVSVRLAQYKRLCFFYPFIFFSSSMVSIFFTNKTFYVPFVSLPFSSIFVLCSDSLLNCFSVFLRCFAIPCCSFFSLSYSLNFL